MSDTNAASELERLSMQLADARQQINSLKISVRAEELKVKISSEYSNFGLWEYDIAEDVCYQYKKLNGRYEGHLDPVVHFRDTVIGWGIIYAEDIPVFHRFCDALERGDKECGCDVRAMNDDLDIVWFRYEGKTVYDDSGKPIRVVGRTLDVTEEKGGVGITSDDRHDQATGTYNAQVFEQTVTERTSGTNRFKPAVLMLISLDRESELCQRYGSEFSGYLKKTVGKVLMNVGAGVHDSFVGYVEDGVYGFFARLSDFNKLTELAERILSEINSFPYDRDAWVTASVGVALIKNGKRYEDAYSQAKTALKSASDKGGNCFMQYSAAMAAANAHTGAGVFEESRIFSAGIANIYDLITQAFINKEHRHEIMIQALCAAGRTFGTEIAVLTVINSDGAPVSEQYLVSDGSPLSAPFVETDLRGDALRSYLDCEQNIFLGTEDSTSHFKLVGDYSNAFAYLRAIMGESGLVGWFGFCAAKKPEESETETAIIELISKAINKMYAAKEADEREAKMLHLSQTVINNLRIEGMTIIPGSFEVEFVGENCFAHYGLKKGDICYQKMHGRSTPCRECPAVQLGKGGKMLASCAMYNENEHTWLDVTASAEDNADGELRYFISSTNITNCLGKIKNHDSLTGAMTFDMFTAEAMRLTSADSQGYNVVVVNVAGFRRINEDSGYEFGNSVLITVCDILEASVSAGELIGRSEGSRFIALLKSRNYQDLEVRLNQLLASIQKQIYSKFGKQIYLIAGVYEMGEDGVGIMTALDRAITAQKTIKDKSYYQENLIAQYDTSLKDQLKNRRYIEAHMVEALENDEFKVYYQPKVSIASGKVVGAEALVRWIRPGGEIISPGKFVPIFEENGFIADMDFAIYRRTIADIKRWLRKNMEIPLISLNVSRHHLKDESFPRKLQALVDSLGVPHELIELEITESLLTENLGQLVDTMTELKSAGFRISIDDFGSGYSSLNLITLLPFDTLKIDGGFFLKNDLTERNRKVISSVVTLAKSLNLETVSEGVETQVQVDFLRDLGCDMIQGYFYYKPMPCEEFERLISGEDIGEKQEKLNHT